MQRLRRTAALRGLAPSRAAPQGCRQRIRSFPTRSNAKCRRSCWLERPARCSGVKMGSVISAKRDAAALCDEWSLGCAETKVAPSGQRRAAGDAVSQRAHGTAPLGTPCVQRAAPSFHGPGHADATAHCNEVRSTALASGMPWFCQGQQFADVDTARMCTTVMSLIGCLYNLFFTLTPWMAASRARGPLHGQLAGQLAAATCASRRQHRDRRPASHHVDVSVRRSAVCAPGYRCFVPSMH